MLGAWHGPIGAGAVTETVKVIAKPGYAIGGLKGRAGAGGVGLSITFMKELKGKLDPSDSYESEWFGATVGNGPNAIGGTGELARGLAGTTNADVLSAIGLMYPQAEKKNPDPKNPEAGIASAPVTPVRYGPRGPRILGGPFDQEYRDSAPDKGVLVGFEIGLGTTGGKDAVKALRPIYRVGAEDSLGQSFGPGEPFKAEVTQVVKVVAKPGYAVGNVSVSPSAGLVGLSIKFMKLTDGKLDLKDSYESEWIGGKFGNPVRMGDGTPMVGVLLRANPRMVTGVGFVYPDTNKPGLDGPWPAGKPTRLHGGVGDPEFREAGPERAILVGFEFRVAQYVNAPAVGAIRPIFRALEKDTVGEWHGAATTDVVKVVAKPGFAVGAISAKGQRVVEASR